MDNFSKGQEAGYLQEWAASARDAVNRLEDFADLMDRIRDEHSEYDYSDFQARCAGMFGDGLESFLDGTHWTSTSSPRCWRPASFQNPPRTRSSIRWPRSSDSRSQTSSTYIPGRKAPMARSLERAEGDQSNGRHTSNRHASTADRSGNRG